MPETNDPEVAENAALFLRLKGWVRDSQSQHADWYKEAEECFGFVAGRSVGSSSGQWPDTSYDDMVASGRQPVEFNRIGPAIEIICGLEVNNRQEVKFLPRTDGDVTVNERLSSLGEWARDEGHAEDEESDGFRNAVICGRGWVETRLDFDEEPDGKVVFDSIDPLECGVDPASKKPNFTDSQYRWRYRDLPTAEAKAMFPGLEAPSLNASWAKIVQTEDGGEGNKTDYPDETRPALRAGQADPKTVRVVQVQWWERETVMLVAAEGAAEPTEIAADAWAELEEGGETEGMVAQKVSRRRYYQAFLGFGAVLEKREIKGFTLNAITGRLDRNKGYHYGMVRAMRDPQMLGNKTLSQVLHILNTNAKGGLLYETGAFKNPRDAEKDWSNPQKSIALNEGGINKIKDRTSPPLPATLVQLQEYAISSIRDVSGVNVEMLGMADRDQPASLEYQRRQSAMTILASLFGSLRRYRKLSGRTLIEQLKLMPPGVLVRVLIDPEQAQAVYAQQMTEWGQAAAQAQAQGQQPPPQPEPPGAEFLSRKVGEQFDPNKFGLGPDARFDVIVDETSASPNQKEATWAAIQPFMGGLPPTAIPIALKASPLPESVAKELGDAITKAGAPPEIPPEVQKQIDDGLERLKSLEEENARLKGDKAIDGYEAATKRMKVEADIAQPGEIDELREMMATLAQSQQVLIQMVTGGMQNGQG